MSDPATYKLNHSMIRVKDPTSSVAFYEHLGLTVLQTLKLPDYRLDLYFLAYDSPESASHGQHMSDRQGVLELSYSYDVKATHNGNTEPKGFGYICVSVDNVQAACQRLVDAGYTFQQTLSDDDAIVLDPDNYWVKLIPQNTPRGLDRLRATDVAKYRMNHTMLRVKDKDVSVQFYTDVFGMSLIDSRQSPDSDHESFLVGFPGNEGGATSASTEEGLLNLVWYAGTEKTGRVSYHNGNTEPEGFGHICVSVDDISLACQRFEQKGVSWQKRLEDGPFRIAFVLDPDGYWVEIIQNEKFAPAQHDI